jgi:hypothetical protein
MGLGHCGTSTASAMITLPRCSVGAALPLTLGGWREATPGRPFSPCLCGGATLRRPRGVTRTENSRPLDVMVIWQAAVVARHESCSANVVERGFQAGESNMGKLLLCATVLTGTAAAGTLVLLAGAAAAGGAAVVGCCSSRQRIHWI